MKEIIFKNRKPNIEKLQSYGFKVQGDIYTYSCDLMSGTMKLTVIVHPDGRIMTQVTDTLGGEEYILHHTAGAVGTYVGQVRAEYEAVLDEISEVCFDPDVFGEGQVKQLIVYVRRTYGEELEFLWQKFPNNAVWRRKDTGKWYAALLTVSKRKLGLDDDRMITILDLRIRPEELESLIDNKTYFPGYHMNKKHWYTICLDGSVSFDEICRRIVESYELAVK